MGDDGTETPDTRFVRGLSEGYSESLFDILLAWLNRNPPRPALHNDGKIGIFDQRPAPHGLAPRTYARESAIFFLKELLECPAPWRLGKCKNLQCGTYFARKRARKGILKRGAYCGKCLLIGGAERTRRSRQHRKNQQLDAAAGVWPQWRNKPNTPNRSGWVASEVNKRFPRWPGIKGKWVTQNSTEILKRVERIAGSLSAT